MDGWVGGYLVVPTLHLHLHLHYLYSPFLFLLVLLLVILILWSFLLGTIFKESPLIILQRKFPEKRQNFLRCGLGSVTLPT